MAIVPAAVFFNFFPKHHMMRIYRDGAKERKRFWTEAMIPFPVDGISPLQMVCHHPYAVKRKIIICRLQLYIWMEAQESKENELLHTFNSPVVVSELTIPGAAIDYSVL